MSIPGVGLLGNGTEDEKGSNFTKACFPVMKAAVPGFVGNCEGTDLTSGNFDVVVADGMSGNIALKATEGAAKFLLQELKGAFMASLGTKIAALLIKKRCARSRQSSRAMLRAAPFCWACVAWS